MCQIPYTGQFFQVCSEECHLIWVIFSSSYRLRFCVFGSMSQEWCSQYMMSVCPTIGHVDSDHLVILGYGQVFLFEVCFVF